MSEYKLKFFDDYIVRRDSEGMDGDEPLYMYNELEKKDYDLLKSGLIDVELYKYELHHINLAGKSLLWDVGSGEFDWLEFKVGDWKFWFQGDRDEPELEVISHFGKGGYVDAEYVFMSPEEYENTFKA